MGLFNKGKIKDIEQALIQKMMDSELLDFVIESFINEPEYQWLRVGTYGDNGWRKVIVLPAGIIFEKPGAYQKRDTNNYVGIDFKSSGYNQIESHSNERGKTDISRSRMCFLYATAIQNRMKIEFKDCGFSKVSNDRDLSAFDGDGVEIAFNLLMDVGAKAEFEYQVPVPKSSSLF